MSSIQLLALVIGLLAVLIGLGVLGYLAYRQVERSTLIQLVRRQEAVGAAGRSLEAALERLAAADEASLDEFANDPQSIERRVLAETAHQALALTDELDTIPVPRRLLGAAQALADAAFVVGEEAGRVGDEVVGDDAIAALDSIDLERVAGVFKEARPVLGAVCEECRLDDQSVYGGGLYL